MPPFNPEKLAKLQARGRTQLGGRGSVRRKKKVQHRSAVDDKKVKNALSKMQLKDFPAVEEVNFFKEDGSVLHFKRPKVQTSIAANCTVVSGVPEQKALQDLLPGILQQLGMENMKKLYSQIAPEAMAGANAAAAADDDDDDVPDLVDGTFEDAANDLM